jgi:transcriptional regulator with XRE-family HTH domain
MDSSSDLARAFRLRRQVLRMSLSELAVRSGVSHATVQRILSGVETTSRFDNLMAIANALGMELLASERCSPQAFREQQAEAKARKLVGMVQSTSALESQAVGEATLQSMVQQTTHELLTGSSRRLWSDL